MSGAFSRFQVRPELRVTRVSPSRLEQSQRSTSAGLTIVVRDHTPDLLLLTPTDNLLPVQDLVGDSDPVKSDEVFEVDDASRVTVGILKGDDELGSLGVRDKEVSNRGSGVDEDIDGHGVGGGLDDGLRDDASGEGSVRKGSGVETRFGLT